jgi:hypothetical protein
LAAGFECSGDGDALGDLRFLCLSAATRRRSLELPGVRRGVRTGPPGFLDDSSRFREDVRGEFSGEFTREYGSSWDGRVHEPKVGRGSNITSATVPPVALIMKDSNSLETKLKTPESRPVEDGPWSAILRINDKVLEFNRCKQHVPGPPNPIIPSLLPSREYSSGIHTISSAELWLELQSYCRRRMSVSS